VNLVMMRDILKMTLTCVVSAKDLKIFKLAGAGCLLKIWVCLRLEISVGTILQSLAERVILRFSAFHFLPYF
jgi:hypothetical protein